MRSSERGRSIVAVLVLLAVAFLCNWLSIPSRQESVRAQQTADRKAYIQAEKETEAGAKAALKKARATLSAGAAAKLNKEPDAGRTWQDRAWARATATKARSVLDRITTARERRPTPTATRQPDAQTAYNDDDRLVWRILRHLFRGRRR